jgi:hypothetical protein
MTDSQLHLLQSWNYSVQALKDGYELGRVDVSLTTSQRGQTIVVPIITLKRKTEAETNVKIEVKVTVRNAADRNGISGAWVRLVGQDSITSGVYRCAGSGD